MTKSTAAAQQLAVYHDPFSTATTQPKIPDGKAIESLGLSTQAVVELTTDNVTTSNRQTPVGEMHLMLFPGYNCCLAVAGDTTGAIYNPNPLGRAVRQNIVELSGAGNLYLDGVTQEAGGPVRLTNYYHNWRAVSTGLVLTLLNPAEENDGWWEACRVTEKFRSEDWKILSPNGVNSTAKKCCAPCDLLRDYIPRNIVNERSYCTGALRNIHQHRFVLQPKTDDHDMCPQVEAWTFEGKEIHEIDAGQLSFADDRGRLKQFIDMVNDDSYDMIYIRIHGRVDPATPTRLHANMVHNQEVVYSSERTESRYQTKGEDIGSKMDEEQHAKKAPDAAAQSHRMKPGT